MLDSSLERACARAFERVRQDRLAEALARIIDIPSPTGEEGPLAREIVSLLRQCGVAAKEQVVQGAQSNAVGVLRGTGNGHSLLLYSPIDTVTSNDSSEDLPWAGQTLRRDMTARSWREGDTVFGLGAQNPKAHAACILVAAEALAATEAPLRGDLLVGFGAGGMPTDSRPGQPPDTGHGVGCAHMLRSTPRPDYAIIAKTGWFVSWEEVGLAWYEVRVRGTHTYVGSRHLLPYVNAIRQAARVVERLEAWFPTWAEAHRDGLVAPQGVVSFIEAGTERTAAFTPAECRVRFDLRLSPRTAPEAADQAVERLLRELATDFEIDLTWRRLVAIPGTTTSPDNWIIRSSIESWEALSGMSHEPILGLSGATDANILRRHGIPTARVGLPKAPIAGLDFQLGMNAAHLAHMEQLTKFLIRTALITCNRDRGAQNG
jgi:succinyl-diaminopimelate desuccinylase